MKKYLYITIATGLAFVLAGVMAYQSRRITMLEKTVEETYRSALHQTAEEAADLALCLEKALITTDAAHTAQLLHHIGQTAGNVQQHLAYLPVSPQAMQPVLRFAGQLSANSEAWLEELVATGQLEDRTQLAQPLAVCSQLSSQLALAESTADLESLAITAELPQAATPQPRGLPQGEITQEEALDIARSLVGDSRVKAIQAAPGTSGSLAAYGVTVQTDDVQLNLEVTRQGGKLLWMMPETASFPITQSPHACQQAAVDFLALHGFGAVQPVYHQVYDGLYVVSLVPVQGDVLLYPDLLRVQVRMDTAEVVGLEAHNYWLNHVPRSLPAPTLSISAAQEHIADHAQVEDTRLCLIPQGDEEVLCYEVSVTHNGESYLIYIDAQSGREVELLKTITIDNGSLTA
ncbi:MAG: germination protein YpeB [Clostridia bacterium]|nr:germination protein YpeB [Clostridia bacterium]